ncbi:MAG: type I methionyl aminopeptidase [Patescibacteria group bacterium]
MSKTDAPAAQRRAGEIVARTLGMLRNAAVPGVSGIELDRQAEALIRSHGGVPAFKGYRGFPASVCLSVNAQVVHGIPTDQPLADGDLASFDVGAQVDGYYADAALTVGVGNIPADAARLLAVTEEALGIALGEARDGRTTGDLGAAVDAYVKEQGFAVVRDCVGHGIGTKLHEEPSIPNFGKKGKGSRFSTGMVVAIEPMVVAGNPRLEIAADHWTLSTADGSLAAHAEETVVITDGAPIRLTPATLRLSGENPGARLRKATPGESR